MITMLRIVGNTAIVGFPLAILVNGFGLLPVALALFGVVVLVLAWALMLRGFNGP